MKNNFFHYLYCFIIAILSLCVLILILKDGCRGKESGSTVQTIVKHDTVYKPSPVKTIPASPVQLTVTRKSDFKFLPVGYIQQPVLPELTIPAVDKNEYSQPDSIRVYNESCALKNGKDSIGVFTVNDSVKGEILARRINYALNIQTPVMPEKKKAAFYGEFQIMGNSSMPLNYAGFNLKYQPKNGKNIYSIGAGINQKLLLFNGAYAFKIGK